MIISLENKDLTCTYTTSTLGDVIMEQKTYVVEFSKFAAKQAARLPLHILEALEFWRTTVERFGLPEARKTRSYHDEPLKGQRAGQRSVRLSKAYRVIYEEKDHGEIVIIGVLEVNKHDY
jgi:proteic killer suppression protein